MAAAVTSEVLQALQVSKRGPELCNEHWNLVKGPRHHRRHALHVQDPATALNTAEQLQLLAQQGSSEGACSPELAQALGAALLAGFTGGTQQLRLLAAALSTLRAWCTSTDSRAAIAQQLPLEELVR
jgi:hypothetical protein